MQIRTRDGHAAPARGRIRRKNLNLDQGLIDRARAALGVVTETEAVTRALEGAVDLAVLRREIRAGTKALYGRGGFSHADDPASLDFSGLSGTRRARPAARGRAAG